MAMRFGYLFVGMKPVLKQEIQCNVKPGGSIVAACRTAIVGGNNKVLVDGYAQTCAIAYVQLFVVAGEVVCLVVARVKC